MSESSTVHLRVPSSVEHLDVVQALAERLASMAGFSDDDTLDVGLAVREGAINAMKHGHEWKASLPVDVRFETNATTFTIRIRDCGEGFDPETTPDPTSPENILRTSGRGLLLIRSLVDEIDFVRHDDGMELRLSRKVPSASSSAAAGDGP